jgi:AmmeMemoRadiSam system protein B
MALLYDANGEPIAGSAASRAAAVRPRLVPLEPHPVTLEDGSQGVALRDPYGVLDGMAVVTPAAYWVLAHFDGQRTLPEVRDALLRAGVQVQFADVERLAVQAAQAGLVFGPEQASRRAAALAAFRSARRPPTCAGGSYPDDGPALERMLAGFYTHPEGPGRRDPASRVGEGVRLLVAPHIDFHRGGPVYAHAYAALEGCDAELFVVFGTAHASPPHLFTLTRQDYDTPLGPLETDRAVVDALASEIGEDELFDDELVHKGEHSCEFQVVWLRWLFGGARKVVPILCSSISHLDDPAGETARFLAALDRATAGRMVCYVAGADLAHVGPQYGDPQAPTREELSAFEAQDRGTLAFLASGDAGAFHRDAIVDDERRRLCGVAPIYAAMRASGRAARLLRYGMWTDDTDMVSFAAAAG